MSCQPTQRSSVIESLEDRRLLSAGVVRGTDGDDVIRVGAVLVGDHFRGGATYHVTVTVNDGPARMVKASRAQLTVKAGAGNDTVLFGDNPFDPSDSSGAQAGVRAIVDGGAGDDILVGGPGDDLLRGGRGNDRIAGNGGNDRITGDAGVDHLLGGDGTDAIAGGREADVFYEDDAAAERVDFTIGSRRRFVAEDVLKSAPGDPAPIEPGVETPPSPGQRVVDLPGRFAITVPEGVSYVPQQGIDSFVGQFVGAGLDARFDFGIYTSPPQEREGRTIRDVTVDGKAAQLAVEAGYVVLHVADTGRPSFAPGENDSLSVYVTLNGASVQTAEAMLLSIDFPEPDRPA